MKEEYLKRMQEYLNKEDYEALLKAYEESPVRSLRLHHLKFEDITKNTDMSLEKIEYDPDGYYLNGEEKYGNHPYHHAGAIYFQEPSAMAPVNLYDFKGNELVLDLCASPGGKSSQILERIPNGVLFANEPNKKRAQVLFGNLERMGFKNAIVLNNMPADLSKKFQGLFDVILVDAPCSGEGMMRKDKEAEEGWSPENIKECQERDFEILSEADKMLKKGGYLIYSTCTFAREEDEEMVAHLESLGYECVKGSERVASNTMEGFHKNTYRFYPFFRKGEGQFMALLQKKSDSSLLYKERKAQKENEEFKTVYQFLDDVLDIKIRGIIKEGSRFYLPATNYDFKGLQVFNYGVELGEIENKRFIPFHHLYKALGSHFKNKLVLDVNDSRVLHYLKGEEIRDENTPNGFGVLMIGENVLGGFKAVNGNLKNHYPKGLRNQGLIEE